MFPQHFEQYLLARRVAELGLGVIVGRPDAVRDYAPLIAGMAADGKMREAAKNFADAHRDFDADRTSDAIVGRIESYL